MSSTPVRKNPFPGLRPFTPEEDYLFFGREEQTLALLQRLGSNRFVAVVGTSGSGKSSLVRCGLLSELLGGRMLDAGASWQVAVTHPGGNPLALLTDALLDADLYDREVEHARENLLATLSRSHFGLVEAVKQANLGDGTNFLLVVDQFEEIFRFQDAGQRQQEIANEFVSLLLEAVAQKEVPIYVVLTMRSDFIGECGQFEGLAEMVNRGEFLIPRLTREQYKRVIEGPIKVAGGQIAPRLLQRLLNDLGQQADQLPCLQHALMRTWDLWAGKGDAAALDLDDYQRVGKMSQALSLHADEVYESLASDRQRELCRGMFQALTVEESNSRGIRRPQRLSRLCQILEVGADELRPIIDAYRQSGVTFLMPSPEVELADQTIIDISHESLMRVWTRLRQWVEEETQAAGIYHRLSESADLHAQGQAGLYRDPELGIALAWQVSKRPNAAWAERYRPGYAKAIGFLEASQRASVAEEQAREAARQRELEQAHQLTEAQRQRALLEQRAAGRLRVLAAGMALVALFAGGASIVAVNSWWAADAARQTAQRSEQAAQNSAADARREAERATTQEALAKEARDEAEIRAYTASLAAAAADLQRNDSRTLRRRLEATPERLRGWEWTYLWNESDRSLQTTLTLPPVNEGYRMDLSGDSKLVAVRPHGGNGEPIAIYDTATGARVAVLTTYSSSMPLMTFSADNKLLAYHHHGTPGVQIYNIETGRPMVQAPHKYRAFLGFDPQAERVVLLDDQSKVRIFKTADFSQVAELPGDVPPGDFRRRGAISSDGKLLVVSAFRDDPMRIFDLSSNQLLKDIPDAEAAVALRFDDTGRTVTTVSSAGALAEYAAPEWKKTFQTQEARQERVGLAVHRLDSQLLRLSFDSAGAVALFDPRLNRSATLRGHGVPGESIAVDKERDQIVSTHRDGTIRRWDLRHPQELRLNTQAVAFTPDGSMAYAGLSAHSQSGQQLGAVDPVTGRLQGFLRWFPWSVSHGSTAAQMASSPDGRRIAVATASGWGQGRWRIYDLWTGLADHDANFPDSGDMECIGWSKNGQWIAVGGRAKYQGTGLVCLYNASTHQMLAELEGGAGGVHALAFSPGSQQLATASDDGVLRLWDVPGGKLQTSIGKTGDSAVNCVIYSADGRYVVAGLADGTVGAWNVSSGEAIFRSQVHGAGVTCLAFTPDSSRLMTAAADQSLKIFDPAAWRELLTLHLETSARDMSFSPDGKRLALAAGSLVWLETDAETDRTQLRRLARETGNRATPLLTEILTKTQDPLEAREQILAQTASDEVLRQVSLRRLQTALSGEAHEAYQAEKLDEQVTLHLLRQQILLAQGGRATAEQAKRLLAAINATLDPKTIHHQALAEYASAVVNWEIQEGTAEQAWEFVVSPTHSADDQLVAYFGLEPHKRQRSPKPALLKTVAWAEYRVGLYADATETAEQGLTLSGNDNVASAQLLAVIAMAQHRSGQAALAMETSQRLDEMLQQPAVRADKKTVALSREVRAVLAAPLDAPWDEQAAIKSCQQRMEKLQLDGAKVAGWAAWSAARRYVARGELDQAAAAFGPVLKLAKDRAATASTIADIARLPGLLEKLAELTPGNGMLQAELARHFGEQGDLAGATAARAKALQSFEAELAKDSENAALAADLAEALLIDATSWTILKPHEMSSKIGATLELQDDGSILVAGKNSGAETCTLVTQSELPQISAIRLEVLPDGTLPNRGPGRHPSGNFQLTGLRVFTSRNSAGEPADRVRIAKAAASFEHAAADVNVVGTIDETLGTMWHVWGRFGQSHQAFYGLDIPIVTAATRPLIIQLDQRDTLTLGCFRISVSSDPEAFRIEERRLAATKLQDPWAKLGAAYALAGHNDSAAKYLSKALNLAGDYASRKALIELVLSNDEVLAELIKLHQEDSQLQLALARSLGARGTKALGAKDSEDAVASLKQAQDIYTRLLPPVAGWTVHAPIEMATDAGVKLELQKDGSVFVHRPDRNDNYSLVFQSELKGIKGLRLEVLTDSRLPGGGPGWGPNFVLNELRLQAASTANPSQPKTIALRNGVADFSQATSGGFDVRGATDGDVATGWAVWPEVNKDHAAVFETTEDVGDGQPTQLTVRLIQQSTFERHMLGRFRLSFTNDAATLRQTQLRLDLKDDEVLSLSITLAKAFAQNGQAKDAVSTMADSMQLATDRARRIRVITEAEALEGVLAGLADRTVDDVQFQTELARHFAAQGNAPAADAARTKAQALFEQRLAKEPDNWALAADLADLLLIGTTPWTVLKPSELTSQGGETMTVESDGSIFVSGPTPDRPVYTLKFPTAVPALTLLRLETIPDARLPQGGAGRTIHGNFHLSELTATVEPGQAGAKPAPIDFGLAVADDSSNPELSLDHDAQTLWDTWPRHLQSHWAVFAAKSPVPLDGGTLAITLDSGAMHGGKHGLGRFRLSACADPTLFGQEQKRIAAMKIADPWAKLAAAYALTGDLERASNLFAKSGINGIGASLESGYLADEVLDALKSRHPQLYATALPNSATAAAERGQVDQARSHYERLTRLQPEQALWKERTEQLQPGVLAAWNFDTSLGGWGDGRNCDVSIKDGVLTARTTAPDPQFSTRLSSPAGGKSIVLRYRSGEAFTLQLFWAEGSAGFDDSHRWDYSIPAAAGQWSEIALPFWCQQDLKALRLDPDTSSEHPLEIDSLVLRHVDPDEYQRAVSKVLLEPELARLAQGIAANPMSGPAYAARAAFLSRLGRWREAADDLEQERKLARPDRILYFKVANCRLLAGDIEGHQQLCREMVAQFRETTDANVADSVCKTCLLGPGEINLSKLPIALLREATNDPQQKDNRQWFVACCALISYREGHHEKAIEWTTQTSKLTTQAGALALVVRALAEQQLGRVDQARATLAQAETVIPAELRGLGVEGYAGPLPVSPVSVHHDWLAPEILRREAAKLIRVEAAAQP